MKYCYSFDEERYFGECDSIEAAIIAGRQTMIKESYGECDSNESTDWLVEIYPGHHIWIAEVVPAVSFLRGTKWQPYAENILEAADQLVCDDVVSDDPVFSFSDEHKDELNQLILRFLELHAKCSAYGIRNPVAHPL